MTANITAYGIGVFVHVSAVVLALGVTFAFPFMAATAANVDPRSLPTMHRAISTIERFLITPGLIVLLLAGIYAAEKGNIDYGESWMSVGMAAILIILVMHFFFFLPNNRKGMELSERDLSDGQGEPSEEYMAVARRLSIGGQVAGLITLVAIFFMTVKP